MAILSPSENIALKTEHLRVVYGNVTALADLDIEINAGELVGIIGPNGAGKTSFIKALCGRLKASGAIYIAGDLIKYGANRRRYLGLVPQDIALYSHMTAKENLSVIAKLLGVKRGLRASIVDEALSAVGMTGKSEVLVSALSGGMKRRINVAAAIMHKPRVIIFDEPTAGVDIPARDAVHRLARELAEQGLAVLLVTHELEQAEALCDKILLLSQGETLAFNTPTQILTRAFAGQREVVVRFATPPDATAIAAMQPFEFVKGELPTIWTTMTEASEVSFVSAFMTALKNRDELVREISVRRPGLAALMHRVEKTGKLAS